MPERLTNTTTLVGCLLHGAAYGACLRLFGMPADALLLGAVSAGIAHGLHTVTTRKAGWARIGIGTLLAGAGAPIVAAGFLLMVDFGESAQAVRPLAQALAAIVLGSAWPKLSGVGIQALQNLVAKFTGGAAK